MLQIQIDEKVKNQDQMIIVLERITELLKQGYIMGYDPDWSLKGKDEDLIVDESIEDDDKLCPKCGAPLETRMISNDANPDDKSLEEVLFCPNCDEE